LALLYSYFHFYVKLHLMYDLCDINKVGFEVGFDSPMSVSLPVGVHEHELHGQMLTHKRKTCTSVCACACACVRACPHHGHAVVYVRQDHHGRPAVQQRGLVGHRRDGQRHHRRHGEQQPAERVATGVAHLAHDQLTLRARESESEWICVCQK